MSSVEFLKEDINKSILWYNFYMKSVPIYELKKGLASIIREAEAGRDMIITRHNKPIARLTRPGTEHLHVGSRFGDARLKPAVKGRTRGRYLQVLEEDRAAGGR